MMHTSGRGGPHRDQGYQHLDIIDRYYGAVKPVMHSVKVGIKQVYMKYLADAFAKCM